MILAGIMTRIFLLQSNLGPPDADESVVLLMAKDMTRGHFESFFWGQEYGGTQEAFLVAGFARVGIPLRWAGEISSIGLSVITAILLWRLARPRLGPAVAFLAGALYWSAPILYVWLSQKERGFYGSSVVSCLAALFFAGRFLRNGKHWDMVGLGVAVGSAIWSSPQAFYLLVPAAAWLVGHLVKTKQWRLLRSAPYGAMAAVVGGLPWLWTNAQTGLASLQVPSAPMSTPAERVSLYWRLALPQVTGFKLPYDPTRWIGTRLFLVPHLIVVCLVVLGAVMLARRLPWVPLALAWHPVMFAALSTSFYVAEARYLFLVWPPAALSLAFVAVRFGSGAGAALLAASSASLTLVGGALLVSFGASNPGAFDLEVPETSKILAAMDRLDTRFAYADYWSSYPLEVASGGEVTATPLYVIREPGREEKVRGASRVAYVLRSDGCTENALNAAASVAGQEPPARLETGGPFVVVVPQKPILPENILSSWAKERGSVRADLPDCPL